MDINTHRAHTHKVCALLQFEEDKSLSLRYLLEIENSIISNQTLRLQIRIGICFTVAEFKGMELLLLLILLLRWYHSWGPRKTSWF